MHKQTHDYSIAVVAVVPCDAIVIIIYIFFVIVVQLVKFIQTCTLVLFETINSQFTIDFVVIKFFQTKKKKTTIITTISSFAIGALQTFLNRTQSEP